VGVVLWREHRSFVLIMFGVTHSLQKTMMEFARQSDRAEMTQEMLDDMFTEQEDDNVEGESDAIVDAIFDEIGLGVTSRMQLSVWRRSLPSRCLTAQVRASRHARHSLLVARRRSLRQSARVRV
jgi:hypothetical protein